MKWIKKARVLLIMTGSALFSESVGGYADTIDPVAFAGFRPAALGSAALSSTTNGLQVVHIGWTLLDGVQLDLDNRAGRVNVLMAPVALNRQGARIRFETMAGLQAGREESMHTLSLVAKPTASPSWVIWDWPQPHAGSTSLWAVAPWEVPWSFLTRFPGPWLGAAG